MSYKGITYYEPLVNDITGHEHHNTSIVSTKQDYEITAGRMDAKILSSGVNQRFNAVDMCQYSDANGYIGYGRNYGKNTLEDGVPNSSLINADNVIKRRTDGGWFIYEKMIKRREIKADYQYQIWLRDKRWSDKKKELLKRTYRV